MQLFVENFAWAMMHFGTWMGIDWKVLSFKLTRENTTQHSMSENIRFATGSTESDGKDLRASRDLALLQACSPV